MLGMMPSAPIAACVKAPPLNRSNSPMKPMSPPCAAMRLMMACSIPASTPGVGITAIRRVMKITPIVKKMR